MNPETGEVKQVYAGTPMPTGWVQFHVGEVLEIRGCYFRVKRFNAKKVILKPLAKPTEEKR